MVQLSPALLLLQPPAVRPDGQRPQIALRNQEKEAISGFPPICSSKPSLCPRIKKEVVESLTWLIPSNRWPARSASEGAVGRGAETLVRRWRRLLSRGCARWKRNRRGRNGARSVRQGWDGIWPVITETKLGILLFYLAV